MKLILKLLSSQSNGVWKLEHTDALNRIVGLVYNRFKLGLVDRQFTSVNPMHQQKAGMMVHSLWKSLPS